MNETPSAPLLSVVVTSRNDDHGGDALPRMQRCFLGILAQAEKYRCPTELLVVEWNPPEDRPRLTEAIPWPAAGAYGSARVIEIPPALHRRFKHAANMNLYQMIAKNVGVRRARGRFVVCTCMDILFSNELFAFLASGKLRPGVLYRVDRLDVQNGIPDAPLDEQLAWCAGHVTKAMTKSPAGELHFNACGDFQLMARENWDAIRGYPEYDLFSWHLDSLLNANAHYGGAREQVLPRPLCAYHAEHHWGESVQDKEQIGDLWKRLSRQKVPRIGDAALGILLNLIRRQQAPIIASAPDWGLARECLPETQVVRAAWDQPLAPAAPDPQAASAPSSPALPELRDTARARCLAAVELLRSERAAEAETLLRELQREHQDNAEIAYLLAQALLKQQRYSEAETLLQETRKQAPDHAGLVLQLGQTLWLQHLKLAAPEALALMRRVSEIYEEFLVRHPEHESVALGILGAAQEISLLEYRGHRQRFARKLLAANPAGFAAFDPELRRQWREIVSSGLKLFRLTAEEHEFADNLVASLREGDFSAPARWLAAMLFVPPQRLPVDWSFAAAPEWLAEELWRFLALPQGTFLSQKELGEYCSFLRLLIDNLHARVRKGGEAWRKRAGVFLQLVDLSPLLLESPPTRECYGKCEEIAQSCCGKPPEPPLREPGRKFRLGLYLAQIFRDDNGLAFEMQMASALFGSLDRSRTELYVYFTETYLSFTQNRTEKSPVEKFLALADVARPLPDEFPRRVELLRRDGLDLLLHGPGTLETGQNLALLACRPARRQTLYGCGLGDPGLRTADIIAPETGEPSPAEALRLPGSGLCFADPFTAPLAKDVVARRSEADAIFVSLAHYRQITPQMLELWVRILKQAPESSLVLHAFDWPSRLLHRQEAFLAELNALLQQEGIDAIRLIVAPRMDAGAQLRRVLQASDVFLDTAPRGDPLHLAEALQEGLTPVVWEDASLLSRRDATMLRELELPECIAASAEAYVELAARLALDRPWRQTLRERIAAALTRAPSFLDATAAAQRFAHWLAEQK